MNRIQRRLIFWLFVLIFLLGAPATIFYAIGYSYDWQNHKITQTGGLYFKSTPSNAEIFLDNKLIDTTAALISRLTPNDYKIKISKDGFYDWEKTLPVYPRLVTEARNVFLFPKKINPELINSNATSSIIYYLTDEAEKNRQSQAALTASTTAGWISKNQNLYFISKENYIFYSSDLNGTDKKQLGINPLPTATNYQIFNNNNDFLALTASGELYWLNRQDNNFLKIAANVKKAEFSSDSKKILYYNDNEIHVYFLEDITRQSQPINQATFYPNNEYIAYTTGDQIKIIELDDRDTRNTVDLLSAPAPEVHFNRDNNYFYYKTGIILYRFKLE